VKKWILLLVATALLAHAQDTTLTLPAPSATPADDPAAHQGYPPARYQDLWTKSPFAVETPEDNGVTDSAEYLLVGVAQLGDVTYVSLIDKHNQNHLLVSSDKPLGNLTLSSVAKKSDGIYATLMQNGQPLTLKLEVATAGGGAPPQPMGNNVFPNAPASAGQNIPMPGSFNPASARPFTRIRRPPIHLPPRTNNANGQAPAQAPGQPPPPPGAQ
jgi:hypothetical protein